MQLVVNGLVTNFQQIGKGPVLVLLHGWGDNLNTYETLASHLSANYTVLSLDLPGFGASEAAHETWNLDNYASFVTSFLIKNEISKVHAFVGHSNGAALLIRAFGQKILTADKLILLGAAGIRAKGSLRRTVFKIIAKVGKYATFWLPSTSRQKLQNFLYGAAGSDMLVTPQLKETFKLTVRQDVQADAALITVPTLLIYGANDRATPPEDGRIYSNLIKNSKLEIIPGSGHFVHHDASEKVKELITGYLL